MTEIKCPWCFATLPKQEFLLSVHIETCRYRHIDDSLAKAQDRGPILPATSRKPSLEDYDNR